LLTFAVLIGGVAYVRAQWERTGPLAAPRDVVVPRGGLDHAAAELQAARVISDPFLFRALAWLSQGEGPIRAAEFHFPAGVSPRQALTILRTARPVEHKITIAEGLTAPQIARLFNLADAASGAFETIEEGSILPNTYAYERGTARAALLARARTAMDRALSAAWDGRAADLPLASPREALILASIVERETSLAEERPHVAAVYLNRLRNGMRLQADPTVVYGASGGTGMLDHKLTRADLERDDPFNTYRRVGLPPRPICSPGIDSLRAVTHPARSEDLFFVADGTGGHAFARSFEAHERNVARSRAMMAGPGRTPSAVAASPREDGLD